MHVLDHVDVIRGGVSGFKRPDAPDYAGAWPDNWVNVGASGARRVVKQIEDLVRSNSREATARGASGPP